MKKYLIACVLILAILFGFNYIYYTYGDIYITKTGEIECFTSADSESLYIDKENGLQAFEIKGVNIGLGKPGHYAVEYSIEKDEYLRWFKQIQDMGANVIRIYEISHTAFYDAFYEYNSNNPDPLYLIQGVWLDDEILNSSYSAFDKEFYEGFIDDCKTAVDIIHGRHKRYNKISLFSTKYDKDISKWVYGYLLGVEWEPDVVLYTNNNEPQAEQYDGDYLYTKNASNFEIFLAEVGDTIIKYETEKYAAQRAVAFSNWPITCPLDFDEKIKEAERKYAKVDVENIYSKDSFEGGMFASYHVYPYFPEYVSFERETDENTNNYLEYLKRLNEHHKIPVVISEFGVPSSRGMAAREYNRELGRDQGGISEKKQGESIVSIYKDIMEAGCAGGIAFIWQDEWFKRTWNTMANIDLSSTAYWSDYQANEQYFGLLSFDPGDEVSTCYVDGDASEWTDSEPVSEQNGYSLYMKYDEKFIYFMVEKDGLNIDREKLYIPIDTTYKSGSNKASNLGIEMSEPADFVIEIDGRDNSRLWVQERYNTNIALYGNIIMKGYNQFAEKPAKDSSEFQKVNLLLQEIDYYYNNQKIDLLDYDFNEQDNYYSLEQTYETGKLLYGNANPKAESFNSLADFCAGQGFVEIKLPWELLNFADPTEMHIHDDYYECYGVEYLDIKSMNVGVGNKAFEIEMKPFELEKLSKEPKYHERLKTSYYILKDYWTSD